MGSVVRESKALISLPGQAEVLCLGYVRQEVEGWKLGGVSVIELDFSSLRIEFIARLVDYRSLNRDESTK